MINTRYPWFRWSDGAVKELSRCNLGEEGLLMRMAGHYWKYYPTVPVDLSEELGLPPADIAAFWTENAQFAWRYLKRYLDDQMEANIAAGEKKAAAIAAANTANAARSKEKGVQA